MFITDEKVTEAIEAVVAEAGEEFVYEAEAGATWCHYVHNATDPENRTAGCIVGRVLHRLGVPLEVLIPVNSMAARDTESEASPYVVLSDLAWQSLRAAQMSQDERHPYGRALKKYRVQMGLVQS